MTGTFVTGTFVRWLMRDKVIDGYGDLGRLTKGVERPRP